MAIIYNPTTGELTGGVYQGQDRAIALGAIRDAGSSRRQPGQGQHYVGFVTGQDHVRIQAFYDVDSILASRPSSIRIGYVQFGQLQFNGISVPIDTAQRFFEPKRPLEFLSGITTPHPNRLRYWWVDTYLDLPRKEPFYPLRALAGNPALTESQLFFYPQSAGTFVTGHQSMRSPNEALCASLIGTIDFGNMPSRAPLDPLQDAVDELREKMGLDEGTPVVEIDIVGLRALFEFFAHIKQAIEETGNVVADSFTMQNFLSSEKPFLLVRGTYIEHDHSYFEVAYPILISGDDRQIYRKDFVGGGLPDSWIELLVRLGSDRRFLRGDTLDQKYQPVLHFIQQLRQTFASANQVVTPRFELQTAADALLVRGTFDTEDNEIIYYGRFDADSDHLKLYAFDMNLYSTLDQGSPEQADILDIYTFRVFTNRQPQPGVVAYTLNDLVNYLQERGITTALNPSGQQVIQYNLKTMVCLIDPESNTLEVYDGFTWSCRRTLAADESQWGNVRLVSQSPDKARSSDFRSAVQLLKNHYDSYKEVLVPTPKILWTQ